MRGWKNRMMDGVLRGLQRGGGMAKIFCSTLEKKFVVQHRRRSKFRMQPVVGEQVGPCARIPVLERQKPGLSWVST